MLLIISPPCMSLLTARVPRMTISSIPRISSRMRTERTEEANFLVRRPRSSNAL